MWKKHVQGCIGGNQFATWHFETTLYPRLQTFRVIVNCVQPVCWWNLCKCLPFLKKPCITLVRLLCGSNCLEVSKKVNLPRHERICMHCDSNEVEDTLHFVLRCSKFHAIRLLLLHSIVHNLSIEGHRIWSELSELMVFYILLGLEYPLPHQDIYIIRYLSCVHIHRMYRARMALEPP